MAKRDVKQKTKRRIVQAPRITDNELMTKVTGRPDPHIVSKEEPPMLDRVDNANVNAWSWYYFADGLRELDIAKEKDHRGESKGLSNDTVKIAGVPPFSRSLVSTPSIEVLEKNQKGRDPQCPYETGGMNQIGHLIVASSPGWLVLAVLDLILGDNRDIHRHRFRMQPIARA
ncbi:hypothetical protein K488DRAFT_67344 [Vararia minispora EC-137]|uniref:Uncharacterized protein n=1 Tax=Vararia minispora EC-137 TaxID=1314806 RepID=A0ACB8QYH5_9AGAM|nr:hypothetical protein K488DRAFT_67344 [Vararia minispora EC-137]